MNLKDQEDLDTWVTEVELAQQYIKKLANNEITVKEFDDNATEIEKKKKLKEKVENQKKQEQVDQRKNGRSGKGEKDNYASFCRNCFWEYALPTPNCLKCNKETINYTTRYEELKVKLENYKIVKSKRQERKYKWEMWQKTQAMLWKKSSNNYSKWDVFTDSSEEEIEQEPVLPKDDPNFKALEMDMEKRKQKIESDQKKADILKEDANKHMGLNQYHKAIELYSEALEIKKDFKIAYTNRALAYIKVFQYDLAIKDCTKLLDYCDCFEKGYTQSKPLTFKAFLRRASAKKSIKKYDEALLDIDEALILEPKDKQAFQLKEEIQQQIEIEKQITDIKEKTVDIDTQIKQYIKKDMNKEDFVTLCVFLNSKIENKTYFQKNYGVKQIIEFLNQDLPCYLLLNIYIENNPVFQEEFLKKKGLEILLKKAGEKIKDEDQSDIFENLTTFTLNEAPRHYMQNLKQTELLISQLINPLFQDYEQNPENLSSFINMISNLCYGGQSKIKTFVIDQIDKFIIQMQTVIDCKKKRTKFLILKENIYSLTSNLLTDEATRKKIGANKSFLQSLLYRLQRFDTQKDMKWIKAAEALLGVFINLCHDQIPFIIENFYNLQIVQKLQTFLFSSVINNKICQEIINRTLNIFSKQIYQKDNLQTDFIIKLIPYLEKENIEKGFVNHVLRIFIKILQNQDFNQMIQDQLLKDDYQRIVQYLCVFILQDEEQRFCNTCNLGGYLVQTLIDSSSGFKQIIPRLITICRDGTGLKRKSSAIFLAKLAKDEKNLEVIRQLHGIEILHNISRFIVNQ